MSKLQYSVSEGILEFPSGKCIEVGLASWWDWVESAEAKSFRFETDHGCKSYTARKETLKSGVFWYAYKKIEGKLHKSYIGKSHELTPERLESIAYKLLEPSTPRQHELPKKTIGNSDVGELREMVEEMRRNALERESVVEQLLEQKIRLQNELKELHTSVGNSQYLEGQLRECQHRCIHLENENNRLERLGQDYSQETVARLTAKYGKALKDIEHWKEVAESYKRQAAKLKAEQEELPTGLGNSIGARTVPAIDLGEFYDAVILKHPPRERKLISKPLTRFKTLLAEALTRRGVTVKPD